MRISRTPQRSDELLEVAVEGDVLMLNGESFDFAATPEGGYAVVPSKWIVGDVWRRDGEITLTLIEPYGPPREPETEKLDVES